MKDLIKEVPKELFDIGNPGEKREYLFVGLEGKKETVFLDFGDKLSNKRCPLDGTYLVIYGRGSHNIIECPACYGDYSNLSTGSSEEIITKITSYTRHRIGQLNEEITHLNEEITHLELILRLAKYSDNNIKQLNLKNCLYNKANLSTNKPDLKDKNEHDLEYKNFNQPGSSYC
jgi:hypothetical protein